LEKRDGALGYAQKKLLVQHGKWAPGGPSLILGRCNSNMLQVRSKLVPLIDGQSAKW
jgi:hypothetical protein